MKFNAVKKIKIECLSGSNGIFSLIIVPSDSPRANMEALLGYSGIDNRSNGPAQSSDPQTIEVPDGYEAVNLGFENQNNFGIVFLPSEQAKIFNEMDRINGGNSWSSFKPKLSS